MDENDGLYYRTYTLDVRSVDEKNRSVDVSFSSETPLKRWEWSNPEILLHDPENVDLSVLENLGSVLMNHRPNGPGQPVEIVGRPENIRIEGRRGLATIFFDADEGSELAFQKVKSKSLKGISTGASVKQVLEVAAGDTYEQGGRSWDGPVDLALKWLPREISLTPIAADTSVGINRSLSAINNNRNSQTEDSDMDASEVKTILKEWAKEAGIVTKADIPKAEDIARAAADLVAEDAKPKMQFANETFQDLLNRAGAVSNELKAKVADMASEGKSESDCLRAIQDAVVGNPDASDNSGIGTGLEQRQPGSPLPGFVGDNERTLSTFKDLDDDLFLSGMKDPRVRIV